MILLLLPGLALAGSPDPPSDAVLADLPFLDSDESNRIFVDLAPEGSKRPLRLLLDTGAAHTVMTPLAARELGVSIRKLKQDPYRKMTSLGRDLLFYVDTRSSDTGSRTGWEYGLLGANFLKHYVVEFDFVKRRVRFIDPGRFEVPEQAMAEDETVLPADFTSSRPMVDVTANGVTFPVLLDTGAPMGFIVSGKLAERAGIKSVPNDLFQFGTVMGDVPSQLGATDRLAVGPFHFDGAPTIVLPNGWFNMGLPDDAVIGYDILSQFRVRIDYPRRRLWLKRRPDWKIAFAGKPWQTDGPTMPGGEQPRFGRPADELLEPARAAGPNPGQQVWLELGAPGEGERREGRVAWIEVRGWAGVGTPVQHDIAVVVDVSGSTMWASGIDVDGDGRVGKRRRRIDRHRSFNPAHYSSDTDDTILAAELLATRKLIEVLDPDRSRIGLISFSGGAQIHAPVGTSAADMVDALEELEQNFGSGMTNMAMATEVAIEALVRAGGEDRRKTILILSDGYPTAPGSAQRAAAEALLQAERAYAADLRIYTLGLGIEEADDDDVYAAMARATGGEYRRLEAPGEVVHELPRIDLADVAGVQLHNDTTNEDGQAVRVFPDGSFDGYVALAPGENRIRVTARGDDGGEKSAERLVFFDPREPRDAAEAQFFEDELNVLKAKLALRAVETHLAAEAREGRAARERQRRELEIQAGEPSPE